MNIRQQNTFRMHETVDTVNTRNTAKWASNTKFTAKVGSHRITLMAIRVKVNQQSSARSGAVDARDNSLDSMTDKAIIAAAALHLHAEEVKDERLLAISSVVASDIKKAPHEDAYNKVKLIADTIDPVIEMLADFEYTPADQQDLRDSMEIFHADLGGTYDAQVLQKAATSSIPQLLDEANAIVDSMDYFVKLIGRREPEFAAEYFAAREILDLGLHHEEEQPQPEGAPAK